jgi:hypothetical protein
MRNGGDLLAVVAAPAGSVAFARGKRRLAPTSGLRHRIRIDHISAGICRRGGDVTDDRHRLDGAGGDAAGRGDNAATAKAKAKWEKDS